jgi:AcrR family transcriptional regulator
VAREAGIAKGSLFQYFEDKLDLFATMCGSGADVIHAAVAQGIDYVNDAYFPALRRIVHNWLTFFRTHPLERGIAFAAAHEIDAAASAAVRTVTNAHFVAALQPLVKRAEARGEFRAGIDTDQVMAMTILLLRHLDAAPFHPHIDPVLGLVDKRPREVERVALDLVAALERAYGSGEE